MTKRKVFLKTEFGSNHNSPSSPSDVTPIFPSTIVPPKITTITLKSRGTDSNNQFDFAPWYGIGIDLITYACHQQIERLLNKQDVELETTSVYSYCRGLKTFLHCVSLRSTALRRELTLNDVNRELIDAYLGFLNDTGLSSTTQKTYYSSTKAVLKILIQRGSIQEVPAGDEMTFPANPFPGVWKKGQGAQPLSKAQRNAFSIAVKTAVMPLFSDDVEPTSYLLTCALLIVALHTGRNTWPLLEMRADCLRSHPKNDTLFLVLFKRRGYSNSKVAVRDDAERPSEIETMPTVRPTVARLIRRVIELSERIKDEAPEQLRDRVWLYRMQTSGRGVGARGAVTSLKIDNMDRSIKKLVADFSLVDTDGSPLRINVSRLRKTFVNRIYEILDGDTVSTAAAAGNTVRVTEINYLRPGEDSKKNWNFMGNILFNELLTNSIGATERTPMGQCTNSKNGDFAPRHNGGTCMNFLNCLRCRNYVVTGDDLYRLFSFYWRVLSERKRMHPKRWKRHFAHIVRLIDRDVIEAGLTQRIFKQNDVERERQRARQEPHPFWGSETIMADLAGDAS
jgi:hypothetical protein